MIVLGVLLVKIVLGVLALLAVLGALSLGCQHLVAADVVIHLGRRLPPHLGHCFLIKADLDLVQLPALVLPIVSGSHPGLLPHRPCPFCKAISTWKGALHHWHGSGCSGWFLTRPKMLPRN